MTKEFKIYEYDIVYLSYDEPNAQANWEDLLKKFPQAKWVNGVKGSDLAHKKVAEIANTERVIVVDGDAIVDETFLDQIIELDDSVDETNTVFSWPSKNIINNLQYGNGGIKLMHKSLFDMDVDQYVDLTTSFENFTYIDTIASETHIDSDEYNAWRAAFRECTKLSTNIIKNSNDSINRIYLNAWLYASNSKYSDYIRLGAAQGQDWARNNPDQLYLINDYAWLEQYYKDNK
jgi:hypothetical protein